MMSNDRIFAVRDPRGFRPLTGAYSRIGRSKARHNRFRFRNLRFRSHRCGLRPRCEAGETNGCWTRRCKFPLLFDCTPQSSCIFEHVYFSRPDSLVFGRPVQTSREELGRELAREAGVEADLVVPVPDSGVTAAVGYSAGAAYPSALR